MANASLDQDSLRGNFSKALEGTFLWPFWKARTSYLMLALFMIPFTVFAIYPIARSAYLSLTNYTGTPNVKTEFLGTQNYRDLLSLQIKSLPRRIDEETGEFLFKCGRNYVLQAEVAAAEADGKTCETAYESPVKVLDKGYKEWRTLYTTNEKRVIIGATDQRFWKAMENTAIYVFGTVFINIILGLTIALLLQEQSRLNFVLRTIFFLPTVTAGVAITVVWGWIYRGQSYGLVNSVRIDVFGADNIIPFLDDPTYMMPILIFMAIWGGVGYNMILFLAGLGSISEDLYEAATVDGANTRQKFLYITLPLLRPTTIFLLVTGIIGAFQIFDAAYIIFAGSAGESVGGTLDGALTVVGYLYERGFRFFDLGYASAIAWILFIIIFVFTVINLRLGRANEAY